MKKAAESAHLYPDGNGYYLKEKLAALHQLEPSQIILSNGSNELIEWIGHVLLDNRSNIGLILLPSTQSWRRCSGPRARSFLRLILAMT